MFMCDPFHCSFSSFFSIVHHTLHYLSRHPSQQWSNADSSTREHLSFFSRLTMDCSQIVFNCAHTGNKKRVKVKSFFCQPRSADWTMTTMKKTWNLVESLLRGTRSQLTGYSLCVYSSLNITYSSTRLSKFNSSCVTESVSHIIFLDPTADQREMRVSKNKITEKLSLWKILTLRDSMYSIRRELRRGIWLWRRQQRARERWRGKKSCIMQHDILDAHVCVCDKLKLGLY